MMSWVQVDLRLFTTRFFDKVLYMKVKRLGCSTCVLVFGSWELSHVIFLKLSKKELLAKSKFTKWQLFSLKNDNLGPFWVKIVVILWICSPLQAVSFSSAWEKSRDSTPNSQKTRGHVEHLGMKEILRISAYKIKKTLNLFVNNQVNSNSNSSHHCDRK